MSYIIWFLFLVIGLLFPKSKIVNALQKTWVVVMWGMANEIADIVEYRMHFIYSSFDITPKHLFLEEGLYRNLCYLFRTAGIDMDVYFILLAVFCVLIIDSTMNYFEIEQKGFVWSALMIFPMNEFNVVLQGRLAFCVVLFGLRFLRETNIKNMIFLGLCVVIAGCIHTGAYEFILLYVVYFLKDRKQAFAMISVGIVAEFILSDVIKKIVYRLNVEEFRSIDAYFDDSGSYVRTIGHIIMYLIVITVATYGYKSIEKNEKTELLHKVMWAMMLGYPIIILSTQFRRNLEMMFIIPYMCVAYTSSKLYSYGNSIIIKFLTIIMAAIVFLGLHIRKVSQFQLNYVKYVINGNYISQGIELGWRLMVVLLIFLFMLVFSERFVKTRTKEISFMHFPKIN